ncbi:MAG: cupin [Planctomycetes bacterium]|nr:cupin [Planctomycetota bacterium]
MPGYTLVTEATRIPVPGGKLIEELFGRVNTGTDGFSLAHMIAPVGWSEPAQTPEFGELTVMLRGKMRLELGDGTVDLEAGQALWSEAGQQVRYSNPFDDENEYYSLCIPAFSPDTVHRT